MDSDIAFLATEIRNAISDSTLKQPMSKIDVLMFEAIRLGIFSDVRFAVFRSIYAESKSPPGRCWTTVHGIYWLAKNAARLGFPYSDSLPILPKLDGVGIPSRKTLIPHVEAVANLLESLAASSVADAPEKRMTFSQLKGQVRAIEADEDRGRKHREISSAKTPMKGSREEASFFAALRWEQSAMEGRNRVHQEPGADRVLAVCRDEFGDAKADTLMRLGDRLSLRLECEPAEVWAMSLEEFLKAWKGHGPVGQHQHQATARPREKPEYSANTLKLFPGGIPDNTDLVDLVVRLNTLKDSGKSRTKLPANSWAETARGPEACYLKFGDSSARERLISEREHSREHCSRERMSQL